MVLNMGFIYLKKKVEVENGGPEKIRGSHLGKI